MATRTPEPRTIDTADCAKLVRTALHQAFPATRFKVRTSRYSMGSSVDVSWTDGPTTDQVEMIAKQYEGSTFDGSIDLRSYHTSLLDGEPVRYSADHVMCQRSWSYALMVRVMAEVCAVWDIDPAGSIVQSKYGAHMAPGWEYRTPDGCSECLGDLLYRRINVTVGA